MQRMDVEVIVEIPRGSRNKYEADHETGAIWLDRMLFTATQYPADYGFFPGTLGEDGDPLDAMVILDESTFPGCHIMARPVAVFFMEDEAGRDAKVLCVPATDPRWAGMCDREDLPAHLLDEIGHFFDVYKALEPKKQTTTLGWHSAAIAEAVVTEAQVRAQRASGGH
jgi:inorganic pyrophosphatase